MIIKMATPCQITCRKFGQFARIKLVHVDKIHKTIQSIESRQSNLFVSTIRALKIDNRQSENTGSSFTPRNGHAGFHRIATDGSTCRRLLQKPLTCIQLRYCGALVDRKCWKCDGKTNVETELFFCECGVVQSVPSDLTYFQALGFRQSFDIDLQKLSMLYKDLQVLLHPDKHNQKSEEEISLAVDQSTFINEAYTTLLKPLSRGLYLLELENNPIEESNTSVDAELLMEIMEMNENIAEARGQVDAIQDIEKTNQERMRLCIVEISTAFKGGHTAVAKDLLIRLRYFVNIDNKIKELYRQDMEA